MILILLTVISSLNLRYIEGGVPHAITSEGQVIWSIPQNRGGRPTLVIGDTTILTHGVGPNEGAPAVIHYDEMSGTAIIQGVVKRYQLQIFGEVKGEADYELEQLKGRPRKVLQTKFGKGEIFRLMTDSFEWYYDNSRQETMIYKMDPDRVGIASYVYTGTQAFVIVDNFTKEAIIFKPDEGSAKVALDPFDQFKIKYNRSSFKCYTSGFAFIHEGKEYYVVTSHEGHFVMFSINGEVVRTKTLFNAEDGSIHLGTQEGLDGVQALGEHKGTIVLIDWDDATFRYLPVTSLFE